MTIEIDDDTAVAWWDSVGRNVREAAGDQAEALLDSVRFLESLDPMADMDPDDPDFGAEVREAAKAFLGEGEPVHDRIGGRVLEARGTDVSGGRIFEVQIVKAGRSRNGNRYPAKVLSAAAPLYEGAKAYDRHRTPAELQSSTIQGLVGHYRNVRATDDGLYGDLHLFPSATHTAEALDASLAAQAAGLKPLVGISHDAMTVLRPVFEGGKRTQEAVRITHVNSADVVADPSAGGKATRVLAGGYQTDLSYEDDDEEDNVTVTTEAVLAALKTATPEQLAEHGLTRTTEAKTDTGGVTPPTADGEAVSKGTFFGRLLIERKLEAAGLPSTITDELAANLPQRIVESDVDAAISALKKMMGVVERAGLEPTYTVEVVKEARDKKVAALDAYFAGDYSRGYHSFREAYLDITGYRPNRIGGDGLARRILRESFGRGYDSDEAVRTLESGDTSTWAQILGDSVTRRMVAEYNLDSLSSWRLIVSSTPPVMDFRTQRVGRMGGYGTLPAVNQGQPYQPLPTPGDEEATYALTKRGGTEDMTLEVIANDDRGVIQKIPRKLGRAAAQTLYRFVWDMLVNNDTCTFDSVALFHSGSHANTDTSAALNQSNLSVGRRKMIEQTAYGDSVEVLGLTPRYLAVPPELEEIAFQLCTSAVAIPSTPAGPSDTPNIHSANGLRSILVPYLSDANDWFLIADPGQVPTIEVGFYQGRQEPELFTQSDPNSGSVFNSDSFTWKIRHIYSGTIVDYRGFYRGQG